MKNCLICQNIKLYYAVIADFAMERVKFFNVFDFAMLKVCLLSIGMLLGAFYSKHIKKSAFFIIIIALCSYIYLIYKLFYDDEIYD